MFAPSQWQMALLCNRRRYFVTTSVIDYRNPRISHVISFFEDWSIFEYTTTYPFIELRRVIAIDLFSQIAIWQKYQKFVSSKCWV